MSFGFSVGDFISAAGLIRDLITCLNSSFLSSSSSYQELVTELQVLHVGLERIENLQVNGVQQSRIDGIKLAALNCQSILQDFLLKIKKYDASLGIAPTEFSVADRQGSAVTTVDHTLATVSTKRGNVKRIFNKAKRKIQNVERKVEWEMKMTKEVETLRGYIVAHVGSLNLSLSVLGLEDVFRESKQNQQFRHNMATRLDTMEESSTCVKAELTKQDLRLQHNNELSNNILESIQGNVTSQLQSLLDIAQKVSSSNIDIVTFITKVQNTALPPDLRYTWVQEPVKFEDALGRIIPVSSEYDVETLYSIISARFRTGPGQKEVHSGMFELFDSLNPSEIISPVTHDQLLPGMEITMAIMVGRYGKIERCPRPNCLSKDFARPVFSLICRRCKTAFSQAKSQVPRPLRSTNLDSDRTSTSRTYNSITSPASLQKSTDSAALWRKAVQDQQKFRHLRIFISELPATSQNSRKPNYHSRAKQKLEATEDRAKKAFIRHLVSRTKHNLGTIPESSASSPTPDAPVLAGAGAAATHIVHEQHHSPATDTTPIRQEIGGHHYYKNPDLNSIRLSEFRKYAITPPVISRTNSPHRSSRSISSAPSAIFQDWDNFSTTSWSNWSTPGGYKEYGSTAVCVDINGVDLHEHMYDHLQGSFDSLPLDRSIALQAQTSGLLNAKTREVLDLQKLAQIRLMKSRLRFEEGAKDAKEVKRDLKYLRKQVDWMKESAQNRFPEEFKLAESRYPVTAR